MNQQNNNQEPTNQDIIEALNTFSTKTDERFNAVDERFNTLEDSVNKRFDAVDKRFDSIENRLTAI